MGKTVFDGFPRFYCTKNPGFRKKSRNHPTSNGHNFFVCEPILIIFGYLVRYMLALSNYDVFAEFLKNRACTIARSKSQFCENRIHSPTHRNYQITSKNSRRNNAVKFEFRVEILFYIAKINVLTYNIRCL